MKTLRHTWHIILVSTSAWLCVSARAEYSYFSDVTSGSDIVIKELRWPYWNGAYYNTWLNDNWTSVEGITGYFYNGFALPQAGSANPVGVRELINFSFWPLTDPLNVSDTISPVYSSPSTFAAPTIHEGTLMRAPGYWSFWETNVWYRMVLRTWQPTDGTPHRGYAGSWIRDPVAGVWHHMATVQLPFSVTGIDGSDGFQENAGFDSQPQRTDYRNSYYHYQGAWHSSTNFNVYNHIDGFESVGLITNSADGTNSAVYYEVSMSNNISHPVNVAPNTSSPTYHITQPSTPPFDPISISSVSVVAFQNQMLVQWTMASNSSPQFAYQINVITNLLFPAVATAYAIDPEAQQALLTVPMGASVFAAVTITDLFNQSSTFTNFVYGAFPSVSTAASVPGAVNGLNYAYYQSATSYPDDNCATCANWSAMPDFASLTPVSQGAVSGLDLTPRQRRYGYAFNYTGYIQAPSDGIYAFTLNSCDGSKLYIDGQLVINWDGKHSPSDLSGSITLQAGYHALNVQYFFDTQPASLLDGYFDTLSLSWQGPGFSKTAVPVSAFYRVPGAGEPSITLSSPANGIAISDAGVPLSATVVANANAVNQVQFYVGNYCWAQTSSAPYSVNSLFWASATNSVRARLIYNNSNIIDSAVNSVITTNMTLLPWQLTQAFYHNQPNGASIQSNTYSMIGDGVNLLTRQVTGDCTLIAHLAGLPGTGAGPDGSAPDSGWEAGIMFRGTTNMTPGYPWGFTNNAPFTTIYATVGYGTYYQDETMVNGGGGYGYEYAPGGNWFKLQRAGNTFTSSISSDGNTWTPVWVNTLSDFGSTIYAGFFTYAEPSSNPNVHWASFDHLSIIGNVLGPPSVNITPQAAAIYVRQNITFTASASGPGSFSYQWESNNVNIGGAAASNLPLTDVSLSSSGIYTVRVSNAYGSTNASATLAVLPLSVPVTTILSNNPIGYWRLNEPVGPTAYDSAGTNNGTGEGGVTFGAPGVVDSPFTGFESSNLAVQFDGTDADISIPAFNLTTSNFTVTGWVKLNGAQNSWSGVVFSRGSGYGTGLMVANNGDNLELRYTWNDDGNDYNFSTGLNLPTNGVWTFVALTIEQTRAIIYMATNSTLQSATNNVTNSGRTFAGNFYFGYDPSSYQPRRLNGTLDEIAMFGQTLNWGQINQILSAASAGPPPLFINQAGSGVNVFWQNTGSWALQQVGNLTNSAGWWYVNGVTASNGANFFNIPSAVGNSFYRLER